MRQKFSFWIALLPLGVLAGLVSCSTPLGQSHKRQLTDLEPEFRKAEMEQRGLDEFERLKSERPISADPELNAAVQRVGQRLAQVVPLPNAQWEFVVFEDPTPNAFALPGGKVGVHSGLFTISRDDAGLAAVIGHELAHVAADHASERLNERPPGAAMLTNGISLRPGILGSRRLFREQELEADRIGAIYMARAGFDPAQAVELWKRFSNYNSEHGGRHNMAFLSTHPLDKTRIESLEEFLPQAQAQFQPAAPSPVAAPAAAR